MAKKKKRGGQDSVVAEATRIRVSQALQDFRASNDQVYTFDANLSNFERQIVHCLSREMGFKSKSRGGGKQRRVSVYKKVGTLSNDKEKESMINCSFSEQSKMVLVDLFTNCPPQEDELWATNGSASGKSPKKRPNKDPMFSKPSMNKEEMANKLETLASKIQSSANLRKVVEERSRLPISSFKDTITSTVDSHQVVLISGETGCGKTTQVPQFILDHMWGKGESCKIICTQPRRISAISVAERIAYERGENIGDDIGYKIRLESKGGKHSSVVFCTNGIILRVLISNGLNKLRGEASNRQANVDVFGITHIIVDEIHERDCYSDFMLAIIRDMLPSCPNLRLILMSATLDAERFSQYFGGCPVILVPGFTYPVKTFYLEDVLSILKSADNNLLGSAMLSTLDEGYELTEEEKAALDEAISLAWSNDDFDSLLDFVSTEASSKVYNYQHSFDGLTPLMVFAGKGRVGDVCTLISFGVDFSLRSKSGLTALEWAEQENQQETAEVLRKHIDSAASNSLEQQQLVDKYLATINPELIDVVLIEKLLRKICVDSDDGAILVFLPGWDNISKTRERLLANPMFRDPSKFLILSLHSMVPSAEQKKVFKRPPQGCRKIVLSTNIAESAITIDDVVYVIDSGRMKEKSYDPYSNISTLQSSWVSKASARQREGRAGRCQAGICYHLYSKLRAASLSDYQVPEIKRMPIEELCLQVKLLDPNCKIEDFLQKTLDPPISESVNNAIAVLQDIGALSLDEKLTELGEKLGCLPIHPLTSKMIFFAILMNCLDPALTLACASDFRDPFTLPMLPDEKKRATAAKLELAALYGGRSDQLAVVAAFECWKSAKERGQKTWLCSEYFISPRTMEMLDGMRKQLQSELIRNGFIPDEVSSCNLNAHDSGIVHAVLVAGMYPRVGRLLLPRHGKRIVETANSGKVRLHPHSLNFRLSLKKTDDCPLVIYDEITRGDFGMHIRNCTFIGPLPLLLLATEIVVAPAKDDEMKDCNSVENDDPTDEAESDNEMKTDDNFDDEHDKIMSSPSNSVTVVADRWLYFGSTALDVAQIYCLRERLSAAILFKVTHPRQELPFVLAATIHAVACILSYDGLSGISLPAETVGSLQITSLSHEVPATPEGKLSTNRQSTGNNVHPNAHYSVDTNHPVYPAGSVGMSYQMNNGQRPTLQFHNSVGHCSQTHKQSVLRGHSSRGNSSKRQRGNSRNHR